jgi:hypothetical protein
MNIVENLRRQGMMNIKHSNGKNTALLIFCAAVFFLFTCVSANAAQAVGKFSAVEGRVEVMRDGKLPAVIAGIGTTVSANDLIRTKSSSKAEIRFNDGNILKIAQRSRIDISEYATGSKAVISMPEGKIEAVVPKRIVKRIAVSPEGSIFEIRTPAAVAGVRGTDFFMSHYEGASEVVVKEGKVEVYNPKFPETVLTLTAGIMTVIKENAKPAAPEIAPPERMKNYEKDVVKTAPNTDRAVEKAGAAALETEAERQARVAREEAREEAGWQFKHERPSERTFFDRRMPTRTGDDGGGADWTTKAYPKESNKHDAEPPPTRGRVGDDPGWITKAAPKGSNEDDAESPARVTGGDDEVEDAGGIAKMGEELKRFIGCK